MNFQKTFKEFLFLKKLGFQMALGSGF